AATSNRRASPAWPTRLTNSATRASTYCPSRRILGSCPSSQAILNGRPLTVTATWPISPVPLRQCSPDPGERIVDPRGDLAGGFAPAPVLGLARGDPIRCARFSPPPPP